MKEIDTIILTPDGMKNYIDKLVEKKGIKAFVLSYCLDGTAYAPSKKVDLFRIPVAVRNVFKNNTSGVGVVMNRGAYLVGIEDIDLLNDETRKIHEGNIERREEKDGPTG